MYPSLVEMRSGPPDLQVDRRERTQPPRVTSIINLSTNLMVTVRKNKQRY